MAINMIFLNNNSNTNNIDFTEQLIVNDAPNQERL